MPIIRLNTYYKFHGLYRFLDSTSMSGILGDPTNLVVSVHLKSIVFCFRFFSLNDLKLLSKSHGIQYANARKDTLTSSLWNHQCGHTCEGLIYVFKTLPKARTNVLAYFNSTSGNLSASKVAPAVINDDDGSLRTNGVSEGASSATEHLEPASEQCKISIIREWQDEMRTENVRFYVCSTCSRKVTNSESSFFECTWEELALLRNDALPTDLLPQGYNIEAYNFAILNPKGLTNTDAPGDMRICGKCVTSLKNKSMPKFALANWLYYARENLPADVRDAFAQSTIFERMLTSRARSNNICCRFNTGGDKASDGSDDNRDALRNARRGVRGNVMVAPLDVIKMNAVLPPTSHAIKDTMCVVYVGDALPSRSNIQKFSPVLVRKSRVQKIIEFLISENPHYQPTGTFSGFSRENLDALFEAPDEGIPTSVQIGHLPMNDAVAGATSDYTPRNEDNVATTDEVLMENVGYTDGDDTPQSYRAMKIAALGHCLQGKSFLASGKGNVPIPDFYNPSLLTWLFPQLDPWGIGGFYHPKRKVKLSLEEQLGHLLMVDESPFERDSEFAFVFYNIIRKREMSKSLRFTVPYRTHKTIIQNLLKVDPVVLVRLNHECLRDPLYSPRDDEERNAFRLMSSLGMIARHIPGSDGYKVTLRNQIRALILYRGTPTLFITLNPSDVDHPLVRLYAGDEVNLEDMSRGEGLDPWRRKMMAAKNPAACALFFDRIIKRFIKVILRYGRNEPGLYGQCDAYFGTVEAQGKGTLHCHMLIWLKGHLSPRLLREAMHSSDEYREKTFKWLESIIKCELPEDPHSEAIAQRESRVRSKELGDPHPGTQLPQILTASRSNYTQFWNEVRGDLRQLLNEYSWHVHQSTCWKYLRRCQEKKDSNCRMGMDGVMHMKTFLDPETGSIVLRRRHPMIAPYSDVVVYLLRCNMDIKFIGSGHAARAFIYYVTDYITKPSLPVHAGMSALSLAVAKVRNRLVDAHDNTEEPNSGALIGAVITAVNSMMGRHEISHPQVMSYLIGGGDHYTAEKFNILQWGSIFRYVASQLESIEKGAGEAPTDLVDDAQITLEKREATVSNQLLDYIYRSRAVEFDGLCVYDFVSLTSKIKTRSKDADKILSHAGFISWEHPQRSSHYLKLRKVPTIPVILGPSIHNPTLTTESRELWARDVLILFKPWRSVLELKLLSQSWLEAYDAFEKWLKPLHRKIIGNMHILNECKDARSSHSAERRRQSGEVLSGEKDPLQSESDSIEAHESLFNEAWDELYAKVDSRDVAPYGDGQNNLDFLIDEKLGTGLASRLDSHIFKRKVGPRSESVCLDTRVGVASCLNDDDLEMLKAHRLLLGKRPSPVNDDDITDGNGAEGPANKRPRYNSPVIELAALSKYSDLLKGNEKELEIASQVAAQMNLLSNPEQLRAFMIIAAQVICPTERQLLMFVGGVGGTGKSHVIKAIVTLFEVLGRRHELLLGAPTGIAAVLIGGQTLHSLIGSVPHGRRKSRKTEKLISTWSKSRFLIADEVSMVGATFMSELSGRIRQGKGDDAISSGLPFGGVNVIFTGDLGQLKPPIQKPLYAHEIVTDPSFGESRNNHGISAMNGVLLWRQVDTVVELVQNQRQATDPVYANFLSRLRLGKCIQRSAINEDGDFEYLLPRLLENLIKDGEDLSRFDDAPIIVSSKAARDALNAKLVQYHAVRLGQVVCHYHSTDTIRSAGVPLGLREYMWDLPSRVNAEASGRLAMFPGMKVMVTENVAHEYGAVNGREGVIHSIRYKESEEGTRTAFVVYVHIPGSGINIDGFGPDIVPIFPVAKRINHEIIGDNGVKLTGFTRKQIPLLPGYAYTDFKSQGRSLDRALVDITTARGQSAYVMLSRVRSLSGLVILRWFPPSKIYQKMSQELRNELGRLTELREATDTVYS